MILAAGRGKRMGSVSNTNPKPLTKINKFTLIELNILKIKKSGIKKIIINVSWLGKLIKNHVGDGKRYGIKIVYSDEGNNILGTGGGINKALSKLGNKPFWLINADIFTTYKIKNNFYLPKNKLCHLVLVNNPPHNQNGDFDLDQGSIVYNSSRKKKYTFSGMSVISPKLFQGIRKKKFALEPLLRDAAKSKNASGEIFKGTWIDVGTKLRLNRVIKKLK